MLAILRGCLFILLFFVPFLTQSQISKEPRNLQSPNAATMGLFGEVPVSLYTGLPNIEVPMYTFNEKEINIPIALNYHASGVRPDMHPGWVGMGWDLSAQFAVRRTVNDMADEYDNPAAGFGGDNAGYFHNRAILNVSNWNQLAYMQTVTGDDFGGFALDTEPDEFTFEYPGGAGKFYLDHLGNWKVKSNKPLKVSFNNIFLDPPFEGPTGTFVKNPGNFKSFNGFIITDENGTKYYYGQNTNAIEYDMPFFAQNISEFTAVAWYLTKIVSADGHEVNLTYERGKFVNQMYITLYNELNTRTVTSGGIFSTVPNCAVTTGNIIYNSYSGKLISPVYLKSIEGSNSEVLFYRSPSTELKYDQIVYESKYLNYVAYPTTAAFLPFLKPRIPTSTYPDILYLLEFEKLDSIVVSKTTGEHERIFQLSYSASLSQRLTLNSVQEIGKNRETKPPFQFFYNGGSLPGYLSNKTDHWGFYNGTEAPTSNVNTFYNYKEPKSEYLRFGILERIVYPTGGVTEYTYEPHRYYKRIQVNRSAGIDPNFSSNTLAGGLRIQKIISYDINTSSIKNVKEYIYILNYNSDVNVSLGISSGVLGGQSVYYFNDYRRIAFNDNNVIYSKSLFSYQSVLPASENSLGCHVGYSEVIEKLSDGGYTKYYFTNFDNGRVDESGVVYNQSRTAYEKYSSLSDERGNLLKEEVYSSNDVLLQKKEIEYIALNKSSEFVRALSCMVSNVCPGTSVSVEEGSAYKFYTYSYLPSQEKTTQYDLSGLNPVVTNKYFTYNNQYKLLVRDSTFDSKGQNTQTYYRYPFDVLNYTIAGTAPITKPIGYMVQNNIVGTPVEIIQTKEISGAELVVGSQLTEFKNYNTFVKPYREFLFKHQAAVTLKSAFTIYRASDAGTSESISKDSRLYLKATYGSYDTKGNLTDFANDQDVNVAYQWNYAQTLPTAKVINAQTAPGKEFFYQGFEEDPAAATATPFAGRKYYLGDYTVPFSAPNGKTYYVNYYSLQSGTWVKITKQFYNNSILNEGAAIDEVRVYPSDAQITSYTYDPVVGMTSESDVNGVSRLYQYDGLGRLTTVRDENKNILKQYAYNYQGWQPTGLTQCKICPNNPSSISNILMVQYKDNNPASPTHTQTRWVEAGPSSQCVPPAQWQNTASAIECVKNEINQNTGQRQRQQIDANPCSADYNKTRWVIVDTNTTVCPIPMTQIIVNSYVFIGSGTISFVGSAGTFTYGLPSNVTNYILGSIPYGLYDVIISASGSYSYSMGGIFYAGGNQTILGRPIGGAQYPIIINAYP